jgi:hypothetical protein
MSLLLQQLADGLEGSAAVISLGPKAVGDLQALGFDATADTDGIVRVDGTMIRSALEPPEILSVPEPTPTVVSVTTKPKRRRRSSQHKE